MSAVAHLPTPTPNQAVEILASAVDGETLETISRVVPGGRQGLDLRAGGIAVIRAAILEGSAPSLLIVDLSEEDQPVQEITALRDMIGPVCPIIGLGAANDVALFRALIGAGITDYLVKPLNGPELRRTLLTAQAPDAKEEETKNARVGVFIGARGGVGATMLAVGTGLKSAERHGKQTALVDLDVHFGTAALALDLEPGPGLRNALEHADRIDSLFVASALVTHSNLFSVMGGEEAPDRNLRVEEESLKRLVEELRLVNDIVVFDLPRHLVPVAAPLLSTADAIHIVSDLSLAGMRDTLRLKETIDLWVTDVPVHLLINRTGLNPQGELPIAEFERGVGMKVHAKLDEDRQTGRELMQGKQLKRLVEKGKAAQLIERLATDLVGEAPPAKKGFSLFGGGKSKAKTDDAKKAEAGQAKKKG